MELIPPQTQLLPEEAAARELGNALQRACSVTDGDGGTGSPSSGRCPRALAVRFYGEPGGAGGALETSPAHGQASKQKGTRTSRSAVGRRWLQCFCLGAPAAPSKGPGRVAAEGCGGPLPPGPTRAVLLVFPEPDVSTVPRAPPPPLPPATPTLDAPPHSGGCGGQRLSPVQPTAATKPSPSPPALVGPSLEAVFLDGLPLVVTAFSCDGAVRYQNAASLLYYGPLLGAAAGGPAAAASQQGSTGTPFSTAAAVAAAAAAAASSFPGGYVSEGCSSSAWAGGGGGSEGLGARFPLLLDLFALDRAKLGAMLEATLGPQARGGGVGVWEGIVRVPNSLNPAGVVYSASFSAPLHTVSANTPAAAAAASPLAPLRPLQADAQFSLCAATLSGGAAGEEPAGLGRKQRTRPHTREAHLSFTSAEPWATSSWKVAFDQSVIEASSSIVFDDASRAAVAVSIEPCVHSSSAHFSPGPAAHTGASAPTSARPSGRGPGYRATARPPPRSALPAGTVCVPAVSQSPLAPLNSAEELQGAAVEDVDVVFPLQPLVNLGHLARRRSAVLPQAGAMGLPPVPQVLQRDVSVPEMPRDQCVERVGGDNVVAAAHGQAGDQTSAHMAPASPWRRPAGSVGVPFRRASFSARCLSGVATVESGGASSVPAAPSAVAVRPATVDGRRGPRRNYSLRILTAAPGSGEPFAAALNSPRSPLPSASLGASTSGANRFRVMQFASSLRTAPRGRSSCLSPEGGVSSGGSPSGATRSIREASGGGQGPVLRGFSGVGSQAIEVGRVTAAFPTPGHTEGAEHQAEALAWHELRAMAVVDPSSGEAYLVLLQKDVTAKVEAERHIAQVTETEHRLLEQIFPRHVLAYMTEEGAAPQAVPVPPSPMLSGSAGHNCQPRPMDWRPCVRDCTRLATWHPQVTILFADIQGFTPMCKQLAPTVVMKFLNDLFVRFDSLLDVYGVYKVETIGDCYVVAGGLIAEDADGMAAVTDSARDREQADKAFAFAQAMLRAARSVSMPTTGEPVRIRVGIHSGPVVSGVVGTRMPRFCLFGDTINTASRMESTSQAGCVHVSSDTYALLSTKDPGWAPTGGIEVKGKGLMETHLWAPPRSSKVAAAAAEVACTLEGPVSAP
ncbi:hypothetical protein HYH03_008602 [Edaphochlamys debaryana]|uniref:Guanylate cyclase domain-containing protein n=1 Tax=Edaphochlamys debaryana TaxID=47281 RepID=A0A836BYP6_9CHLO|nr:hypothetical protein HYH03_008602 [Edaphochlamys debaryana]|eukprot:KAG2493182.1 hypothetical protein HYH03_008602 [Edaphochlamys debaryana]